MPTISTLTVDLTANTTKLDTSLATSVRTIKGHVSAIQDSVDSVKHAFEAFGIGLGVAEITNFIEETIKSAAELKNLAAQAGVTTEQFQVLKFAAGEAGVAQDQMETAVSRLTRSIGEAATGSKPAIDAFNRISVGVLDTQGKVRPTVAVLQDLAKRLAEIPDPALRAATETALFGRAGQDLDQMLGQLSNGLGDAYQKTEQFVGIIGDDSIEKMDQMNNQIEEMKTHLHNLAIEALAATSAIFNFFATGGGHLSPDTVRPVPGETEAQAQLRRFGPPNVSGHELGGGDLNLPGIGSTSNPDPKGAEDAAKLAAKVQAEIKALQDQAEQLKRTGEALDLYNALTKAGVDLDSEAGQQIAELVHQIDQEKSSLQEVSNKADEHNRLTSDAGQIYDATRTPLELYNEKLDEADLLLKRHLLDQTTYDRYLKLIKDDLDKAGKSADGLARGFDDLGSAFGDAASGASDWSSVTTAAIRDVVQWVEQLGNSLIDVASGGDGGGGIFSTIAGGILGLFGIGGGSSFPGTGFGGPKAGGGDVSAGTTYMVGEEGPELFTPDMSGTIIPHDAIDSLASGNRGGSSIVINAPGADAAALRRVEKALHQLNATLENRAIAAVSDSRKRGGSFAKAFSH